MSRAMSAKLGHQTACWLVLAIACWAAMVGKAHAQMARAPIRDPDKTFRSNVWSYKELSQRNIVMQKYDYSCGAAVLATIAHFYWGDKVNELYFLDLLPKLELSEAQMKDRIANGLTLTDLRDLARGGGYDATMVRVPNEQLEQIRVPVIVGIIVNKYCPQRKHEHYVVLRGSDGQFIYLADPIRGNIRMPMDDFIDQWQLNAVLAIAKPNTPVKNPNPLGIRNDEVDRGLLNEQTVRKNYLAPPVPYFLPFGF